MKDIYDDWSDEAVLSELHLYVRHDVIRIDVVTDDETGMDYFVGLWTENPETGEDEEIVLDAETRGRYHEAVRRQFVIRLGAACPRAEIHVSHGPKFALRFTRESPVEIPDQEIWDAIDAFDDDWWAELWIAAYDAVLDESKAHRAPPRGPAPGARRRSPARRPARRRRR